MIIQSQRTASGRIYGLSRSFRSAFGFRPNEAKLSIENVSTANFQKPTIPPTSSTLTSNVDVIYTRYYVLNALNYGLSSSGFLMKTGTDTFSPINRTRSFAVIVTNTLNH
jgi:hypothetical protein